MPAEMGRRADLDSSTIHNQSPTALALILRMVSGVCVHGGGNGSLTQVCVSALQHLALIASIGQCPKP